MLEAMREAQHSIYLEMFIFLADTFKSHDFITVLRDKSLAGVNVILVLDTLGSKPFQNSPESKLLRDAGVEIIFYSHWFRHIHRKLLIVDKTIAFVGGVNIGREYAAWNDLQVQLAGKLLITRLLSSFASTYAMAGGLQEHILKLRTKPLEKKLKWWVVDHWPVRNIHSLKSHYIDKISQAKEHIRIVTPYLTPPRWLISLLDNAIRRGVQVEIIIPKTVGYHWIDRINYRYAYKLHLLGIRFFLDDAMNHSKLLLIDDTIGLVGSQNLDILSFHVNSELGVFFESPKIVHDLKTIWTRWKDKTTPFVPERYRMKFIDYLIFIGMKILHPIL
jgi:cardiolipin synthase